MSPSDQDALTSASAKSQAMISANYTSCREAAEHIHMSKQAIDRSLRLLSETVPPADDTGWMEAAE